MAIPVCLLVGCAGDRYKLPPPLSTQALPGAQGVVYGSPNTQAPANPTRYCITEAGYCNVPSAVDSGLSCTCDSSNPKFSYGGKTGAIPAMPEWADPRLPQDRR